MEQLFRHRVLKMLLDEGLIREDRVRMLNRAPLAVEKVEYLPENEADRRDR
jgi:hypothetical protein